MDCIENLVKTKASVVRVVFEKAGYVGGYIFA